MMNENHYGVRMRKVNCRITDQCIFCKYWYGDIPKMDYRTGECQYSAKQGTCLKKDVPCEPEYICSSFQKKMIYM